VGGEYAQIKVDLTDPFQQAVTGGHENLSHLAKRGL
jgi:hypothetical protein